VTHVLVLSRWCYVLGPEDDEARIFAAEGVLVRLLVMAPQAPSLQDIAAAIVERRPGRPAPAFESRVAAVGKTVRRVLQVHKPRWHQQISYLPTGTESKPTSNTISSWPLFVICFSPYAMSVTQAPPEQAGGSTKVPGARIGFSRN